MTAVAMFATLVANPACTRPRLPVSDAIPTTICKGVTDEVQRRQPELSMRKRVAACATLKGGGYLYAG